MTTDVRSERHRPERSRPNSITVVVPAYNAVATLAEQLDALAAQQYEGDWEVVVVDNGSTDGTADLARRYAQRFPAFGAGTPPRATPGPRLPGANSSRIVTLTMSSRLAGWRQWPTPPANTTSSAGGSTYGA